MNFKREIMDALFTYANQNLSFLHSTWKDPKKIDFEVRSSKLLIRVLSDENPIDQNLFARVIRDTIQEGQTRQDMQCLPDSPFIKLLKAIEQDPSVVSSMRFHSFR